MRGYRNSISICTIKSTLKIMFLMLKNVVPYNEVIYIVFRLFCNENTFSEVSVIIKGVGNLADSSFNYRVLNCSQHSIKLPFISFIKAVDFKHTQEKKVYRAIFLSSIFCLYILFSVIFYFFTRLIFHKYMH